ncbi:MAG TPA: polysaccharide deacetylase family protein [Dyella sp.]|uniref:polysaccharide deacetylase family protein n=1 Tax=Dyella sp. TaxID=1869338 RepID=UPI002D76695B|nr:polysaccharide deacetylase family protein [Dyella sp.]HET6554388.1 polysaccharide deacetylase family protein [Dyella sp.]
MEEAKPTGLRGQLGELCYNSGLLGSLQRMRSWWRRDLRILAYHRIMPLPDPATYDFDLELISAPPERFRQQMLLLKRRFCPMRLSDVAAMLDAGEELPADAVVITFDDGYDDNYRIAFPILRELDIPATFFVSTGHIDTGEPYAYDWLVHMILLTDASRLVLPELGMDQPMPADRPARRKLAGNVLDRMKNISALDQAAMIERLAREWRIAPDAVYQDCRPMNWDQLREMSHAGFEIGSHGVHHWMLSKLPAAELAQEIMGSREALLRELGPHPLLLSYPVGSNRSYDERVIAMAKSADFQLACSYISGTNPQPSHNRYALLRLAVERDMSLGWFASTLTLPSLMSYSTPDYLGKQVGTSACSP